MPASVPASESMSASVPASGGMPPSGSPPASNDDGGPEVHTSEVPTTPSPQPSSSSQSINYKSRSNHGYLAKKSFRFREEGGQIVT
ncbi:hypothetical protein PoB_004417300 [Plakobranchus ocellatus]|uniref:Uncharacterized protein n=1 Tax=Plakobranchus ocellatus TaxID=259542 RepID=A0AAV4BFP0_9GAST|nr:hypothetical protein PoB_004417300 [Plakobranchus ocellatus]